MLSFMIISTFQAALQNISTVQGLAVLLSNQPHFCHIYKVD